MTFKEFAVIAERIKAYFPRDGVFPTKESVSLWYDCLQDLRFDWTQAALKNYVCGNNYPPTIADIRNEYQKILGAESEARVQLRRVYEETVAIYPMANHEPDIERTYKAILNGIEKKDRMKAACRILDRAKRHVRACEESGSSTIEPLTEFVKGIDLDELLN